MSRGQPFRITNSKQIILFNRLAENKDFLSKVNPAVAAKLTAQYSSEIEDELFVKNRQFAEEKIADLESKMAKHVSHINELGKEIAALTSANENLETEMEVLKTNNEEALEWKEKYENLEAQVKKLKAALKKKKDAEGG